MPDFTHHLGSFLAVICCFVALCPSAYADYWTPDGIDGTFVFVSETTTFKGSTTIRRSPEWRGIYIFQKGSYSISLLNAARSDDWTVSFPTGYHQLGYESESGTYTLRGSHLTLRASVSLHPFGYHNSTDFDVRAEVDTLTLISRIPTHSRLIPSGKIVTILRRAALDDLRKL